MTRIETLEREIEQLSVAEFAALRKWMLERDAQLWDEQFERDAASGKLDRHFKQSLEDHAAGKSREI